MKILSFNVWGAYGPDPDARLEFASSEIMRLDADLLCLQEATNAVFVERLSREFGSAPAAAVRDGVGLVIFSRLPVRSSGSAEFTSRSSLERYDRKFVWAVVAGGNGEEFLVANTHLSWKAEDEATRTAQAAELLAFGISRKLPMVFCGDFNCEFRSKPLAALARAGFSDALEGTAHEFRPSWDNRNPFIQSHKSTFPNRRVDLILTDAAFRRRYPRNHAEVVLDRVDGRGVFPSDHYGVLAEFDT
ncbi:MAG: endonuclease/exonuclease/phosphatase family protein [Candidatus Omnitrophica bacterium]|nr:endonuclease/exonuclease/phosphatase family protein [Candidatus Omnitrophota bacterium]